MPSFPSAPGVLRANRLPLLPLQFWCCGKSSPLGLLGGSEADLCQGEEATRQVRGGPATIPGGLATGYPRPSQGGGWPGLGSLDPAGPGAHSFAQLSAWRTETLPSEPSRRAGEGRRPGAELCRTPRVRRAALPGPGSPKPEGHFLGGRPRPQSGQEGVRGSDPLLPKDSGPPHPLAPLPHP